MADWRRHVSFGELNAAAENRLIHQRSAADINVLRGQSIFFEDPVLFHELQKIMGDTDAAVADFDRLQNFNLCLSEPRRRKRHAKETNDNLRAEN